MSMVKKLLLCLAALPLLVAASHSAEARGRVFLGFNFGVPVYGPPPAYYYPPPAYYYPPPPAYYVPPAPTATPAPSCRTFNGDASVDESGQPFYGTACLQPDGRWHIVGQ
jgi:hypothetical protein